MSKQITLLLESTNRQVQAPEGIQAFSLLDDEMDGNVVVAARFNNEYIALADPLTVNGSLAPLTVGDTPGMRIYRKSLSFLFGMACREVLPGRRVVIGHSLGHAFFHQFLDEGPKATETVAQKIESIMRKIVDDDLPIIPDEISWQDARAHFKNGGFSSTALLLEELNQPRVGIWRCGKEMALRHKPLVHRTGLLQVFAVEAYQGGFLLRFPATSSPHHLGEQDAQPDLFTVYEEHKRWGRILGVTTVANLNTLARNRQSARDFIQTAEALHDRKIAQITGQLLQCNPRPRAIMIAGPSSSGKTTFTKKLGLSLKSAGLKPQLISLDDYYKEREDIPLDEDGKPDFELLEALDIEEFNRNLTDLLSGKETEIPIFDFKNIGGRLEHGRTMHLDDDGILIFEGIHGLNPHLTPDLPKDAAFRIYISALTQLNVDDHDRIPTTDNRLIRRIVRDHQFRRYPAVDTLKIWPSVRRGERRHIFPYQSSADAMFNSALDYELSVLKVFAEPQLRAVPPNVPEYGEARRLLSFLRNFSPFPTEEVPELSIIREFIGRSGFRY
ncbi:MAG: nucleoside kinase [Spirochaetales bacterium]|nr:nucleoside kinase [Spirochaetales bacterium]